MRPIFDLAHGGAEYSLDNLRLQARRFVEERPLALPGEYPDEASFEGHIKLMEPDPYIVTFPKDMAVRELFLAAFVWGLGEPPRRECTKIGGLPYWPSQRPWPQSQGGYPATFLARGPRRSA